MSEDDVKKLISDEVARVLGIINRRVGYIETVLDIQNGDFHKRSKLVEGQLDIALKDIKSRIKTIELNQKIGNMVPKKKMTKK